MNMASSVHKSINDLALLLKYLPSPLNDKFNFFLNALQTFLLCARKLNHDASNMEGLLLRIDEMLSKYGESFEPYGGGRYPHRVVVDFEADVKSFEMEIDGWFTSLLLQSSSPQVDDVLEIIDSVLDNLEGYHSSNIYGIADATEAMEEKIRLFQHFILFVGPHCVANREFAIQVAAVAIKAAHLIVKLSYVCLTWKPEGWKQIQSEILALLQLLKPVGPRVFEVYSAALMDCKDSPDMSLDVSVMKEFADFLLHSFRETSPVDSAMRSFNQEDQLWLLWEGLRFLRTILKKQPDTFDDKMKRLSRVVMCDAAVIIFSMYRNNSVTDTGFSDILQKFDMIRAGVEEQVPEPAAASNLPKSVLDFLDFLLASLMEVKTTEATSDAQSHIETIILDFRWSVDVLMKLQNQQPLWDRAVHVATRFQLLIDQLAEGKVPNSLDSIAEDIRDIRAHVSTQETVPSPSTQVPLQIVNAEVGSFEDVQPQMSATTNTQVIGFEEEKRLIINQLKRSTKGLKVVLIVGMAGLGKTTLATQVFNDPAIRTHFHVRGWCSVSQVLNQKKTLLELLSQTVTKLPDGYLDKSEHDLALALYQSLKKRRYLIFLDDLWDIEAWYKLISSLPDDSYESRILVTSQHSSVVPKALLVDEQPYFLRGLTDDESWELLKNKLFSGGDCPQKLCELGQKIAYCCKGLPLTVVIISGLLTSFELVIWEEVLKNLGSGSISLEQQCIKALEMSYNYLPQHMKPCFLYFGLFPEDQEIAVKRLTWAWIAEGFVCKNANKESLEYIATNYIMVLARRSLVTISQNGSLGGAKACRIHDLLHDFCMAQAKKENFFHCLRGNDEILTFEEPFYLPRLSIHSRERDFMDLKLQRPNIQSIRFFPQNEPGKNVVHDISSIVLFFKHLRVLDIMQIDLGYVFPDEMELLARLRFLAVKGRLKELPLSIGNLSKLETFIVDSTAPVTMPHSIWQLHKLRHICIQNGFHFPIEDLENCSTLSELESCSTAIIPSWDICEKLLLKFPNIRRLKCEVFKSWDTENCNTILVPDSLDLKSLHVSLFGQGLLFVWHRVLKHKQFEFHFPQTLTKLTLDHFELPENEVSTIGKLPNLEVLKLLNVSFVGGVFRMSEGEFPMLKFMKLSDSKIVRWTSDDEDSFPKLEKFVLKSCKKLKDIPSCLESLETLQMIEIVDCSQDVESAVERIKESQQDFDNLALKVLIS